MPGLTQRHIDAASAFLAAHWREGRHVAALPPELRPGSRAEGYAIQERIEALSAEPLRGWKIAATSAAGQRHINVDGPMAGRLLAERIVPEGEPVSLGANRMRVAEIEFVFRMARDLPPRDAAYAVEEVMAAVASLHLGIEVPDSRFLDFTTVGAAQLIADNACADQFVLGPEVGAIWRSVDLAAHLVQGRTDRGLVHEGLGANVLGDPRLALTWLVNELSRHGTLLGAKQIVTTGTCVVPIPVEPGDTVTGHYGPFGSLQVRFEA
jgi:2-keto-4-pentenoate hydratase